MNARTDELSTRAQGQTGLMLPTPTEAQQLADADLEGLMARAAELRDKGHGDLISYSRKVFIPLTHLCRDICGYCSFAQTPSADRRPYLSAEEVLALARRGVEAGCKEALFTLGDKPELRYRAARDHLVELGQPTTLSYLAAMARLVLEETGLLPHLNPGLMSEADLHALRPMAASMGIMLETTAARLARPGGPHHNCPDKLPGARLDTIALAGKAAVPFTSGILIGIGENRRERIEALLALRDLAERYGHLQEIIVQSFRAKPSTAMATAIEPDLEELLWTVAVARIVFGPEMNIQAPPNLSPGVLGQIVAAGINDWGGVSPVTPDFVNPEAPWPHLESLREQTRATGKRLTERLAIYPRFCVAGERWLDKAVRPAVLRHMDAEGFARSDGVAVGEEWFAGAKAVPPPLELDPTIVRQAASSLDTILNRACDGEALDADQIVRLFQVRGAELRQVIATADELRAAVNGDTVSYVVNRNINYTNVCYFRCRFCAFSKGKLAESLRGKPFRLTLEEIQRRTAEAWERGGTEICLQGGIHPEYSGQTYLDICQAAKAAAPEIHVHAFSPLEVWHGAKTLGISVPVFLSRLQEAGLGTLPGTAAEILDDRVRRVLCPDKINTHQWLSVMRAAHHLGIKTTATIMFGHIDSPSNWARHLLHLRALQKRTGGFTELVPLPFVHMEAPMFLKGLARRGPSFREALLMHAISRLALHPRIRNIQVSWVKMGAEGAEACLRAGANDLGGTLMNESITRAAGAEHGQEMEPAAMEALVRSVGRSSQQRTTDYEAASDERRRASFCASPLTPSIETGEQRTVRDLRPVLRSATNASACADAWPRQGGENRRRLDRRRELRPHEGI